MKTNINTTTLLLCVLAMFSCNIWAENKHDEELIRAIQRQQQLNSRLLTEADVRLERSTEAFSYLLGENETPCTKVAGIRLDEGVDRLFAFLPAEVVRQTGFSTGMCLGADNLQKLQKAAQQIVLARGYITSSVSILPQDMADGILRLSVNAGKVGSIRYQEKRSGESAAGSIGAFHNKFPLHENKILNLRDVEQGLENLRRLPSVEADIQIMPSEEEGKSDLSVNWQQDKPVRVSVGMDDSGSKTTGKYQGNAAISFDNPLGLSDLFYVAYGRGLGHRVKFTDSDGVETKSGSRNYSVHYSVPFKKWLFSFNHNGYRYHEATEGYSVNYDYNGKQYHSNLAAERMIWRNNRHKTTAAVKFWTRHVYKYIDDTEIEVQRRRTAGWAAELRHRAYLGRWQIDGKLSYKRGTGMRGSLPSPEESDSVDTVSGTSRMKIITAGLDAAVPFKSLGQQFSYETTLFLQWNKTPLVLQDKLSIGSRYTVRGFDGDQSLSGERGFYWQNTLGWHFHPHHQFYFGMDAGRVSGESTEYMPGKHLVGTIAGVKGSRKIGGILHYEVFAGKPLYRPKGFQTAKTVYGFGLNYSF